MINKYRKILVLQTAFLGDVILTTALIREMKNIFIDSEIDVLTIPQTSVLFKYNPNINKIITFNKRKKRTKLGSFIKLIFKIRKEQYDLAFSVQSSFSSSLLLYLGNVHRRVGFSRQKLLTDKIPLNRDIHASKRHLNLLKIFDDQTFDHQTEIFWSDKEESIAKKVIAEETHEYQLFIGIAPGSIWNTKRWPSEYFITLLNLLAEYNFKFFLLGSQGDHQLCQEIIEKSNADAKNLAGQLSIPESCSLIEKIDLMICNDSAPLHMANAVKTDVFAFFGPTVRQFGFYPFRESDKIFEVELDCRPCAKHGGRRCPKKHFKCMKEISPSAVAEEIIKYFDVD